jgi:hypothetical protein
MKKHLACGVVALAIFVVVPGCVVGGAEEDEEISQDEVAMQELESAVPPRACVQPIVIGPCRAAFRRYAFERSTGRCVRFTYGGCQGNENNFTSMGACQRTCAHFRRPL